MAMNRRQKLVQQRFLDNEDAVLKELKKTYKEAQKEIDLKTRGLQARINQLQARIDAETDKDRKAVLQSMQQAKIYQKNYQDALKKQVDGILDNMQVEEFKSISDYLDKCYEESFLGTMYDLHGQDIPLIFPLDQEAMVRAVQLDSKISEGLYKRLGEDVNQLKKDITSEISRGISTGASFEQIAQQIGFKMMGKYDAPGGALAKAMTIARTEGHRIQNQSSMDTCHKAKEKGADVVKQWDSTQDKETRSSHQKVDGEVRELDEPFSNGLQYPGDPSAGAGEVVNCRCALLQRARWAMDDAELETLKKRAEYYGLDKSDTFDDFKKKYMKAAESTFTPAASVAEAVEYMKRFAKTVNMKGVKNHEGLNEVNRALTDLTAKYPIEEFEHLSANSRFKSLAKANYEGIEFKTDFLNRPEEYGAYDWEDRKRRNLENIAEWKKTIAETQMNAATRKSYEKAIRQAEEENKYKRWTVENDSSVYNAVCHEYGHAVADRYFGQINGKDACPTYEANRNNEAYKKCQLVSQTYEKARSSGDIYSLSRYGGSDKYEFFAEAFAAHVMGEPLPDYVEEMFKVVLER